jgi:CubicO group peptidase (beta-lactamase class C family)
MRLACALVLVWSSIVFAQPARIDAVFKEWARKDTPGCAVAVVQAGKTIHAKGYGMADLERGVPITPDTVFDIGSVSKQLTAATVMLLAAGKQLQLDDDIRKYLPELPALSKQPITIRHLLHHTGGLRDYTTLLALTGRQIADVATSAETLALLARQRALELEPGTKHVYSNTGYFVLAQIAERASKQAMADLVRDRIFKPLGMARSLVLDSHVRLVPGRALAYTEAETGGWQLAMSQWEQTGDGAVLTTVRDLAKWDANFRDAKVGGAALVEGLQQRGKLADGTELDYAAGLSHGTYRGQPTIGHSGGWAGYRAELLRFPKQQTTVIVTCNAASARPGAYAHAIADIVLEKQLGKAPATAPTPAAKPTVKLSTAELDAWAGKYRDPKDGSVFEVRRRGDRLVVEGGGDRFILEPTARNTAVLRNTPVALELVGAAPKRTLRMRAGTTFDAQYSELVPFKPAAADVAAYAGRYFSAELGVVWTFTANGTGLEIVGPGLKGPLEIVARDELAIPDASVTLRITRGRGVTGLVANAGSLRGLRFERLR